jgi:hypothetical protein
MPDDTEQDLDHSHYHLPSYVSGLVDWGYIGSADPEGSAPPE